VAEFLGDILHQPTLMEQGLASLVKGIRTAPGIKYDDNGVARPMTLREFTEYVNPRFKWHRHNIEVNDTLQDAIDGKLGIHARIIIIEPPRHGKTEQVSRIFPAYWLYRFPTNEVGLATYGSDLAYTISEQAKNYYVSATSDAAEEREVLDKTAARQWVNTRGGNMWATGIGGPATGKGWHLGIIDDPVKNAEESQSETTGPKNWEWYQSVFYTREAADEDVDMPAQTCLVVMHTRWPGPGDLIGKILEEEKADTEELEHWYVIHLPAIYDGAPLDVPASCTLHPDWRREGEALSPGRFDEKRLMKIKRRVGPYFWASIYQGRPRPKEGGAFKEDWFLYIEPWELKPEDYREIRYWDMGGSEKGAGGDPTVGVKIRVYAPDDIVIVHVALMYKTPAPRDKEIRRIAEADGIGCTQWGPQDPAVAGKAEASHFRSLLAGFKVHTEPVNGDIEVLAGPYQASIENGHTKILRADWNRPFINEHLEQWTGSHDDQVWAAANAYLKGTHRRLKRNRQIVSYAFSNYGN